MSQPSESDERLAQRLREAQGLLDEQPSPKVRTAVLLAAAQRHRRSAGTSAPHARPGDGLRRWLGWRVPLGAGATALVGVLAIAIGLRLQQEQGTPAPAASSSVPDASTRPALRELRAPAAQVPRAPAPVPGTDAAALGAAAGQTAVQGARSARVLPPASAGAAAGPVGPVPAASAQLDQRTQESVLAAPARSRVQSLSAVRASTGPEPWLKQITALRAAGRDAEADRELAAFVAAYPNVAVPPSARQR